MMQADQPHRKPRELVGLLGGALKHVSFIPLHGEMIQFDSFVSNGLKPPTSLGLENLFKSIREQLWKFVDDVALEVAKLFRVPKITSILAVNRDPICSIFTDATGRTQSQLG